MSRFIADATGTGWIRRALRRGCGSLGFAALVAAVVLGHVPPAHADYHPRDREREKLRTCERYGWFFGPRAREACLEDWRSSREEPWYDPRYGPRHDQRHAPDRRHRERPPHEWRPSRGEEGRSDAPSRERDRSGAVTAPEPSRPRRAERTPRPTPSPAAPSTTPEGTAAHRTPSDPPPRAIVEEAPLPLPPIPLLGLLILLLPVAAIGLTVRQRALATASGGAALTLPSSPAPVAPVSYTGVPDPFDVPVLALTGQGVAAAVRMITLATVERAEEPLLVVLPRPDAAVLFGLAEDELLDEPLDRLFLPGTLDAALAYLETELTIRDGSASTGREPRLLLVAECEQETGRIQTLLARHPGAFSAILLGDWPGEQVTVAEDGAVQAPPALAEGLPARLPGMSRAQARQRLDALARQARRKSRSARGRRRARR
ncbi:hypothetical protein [Thermomonospora catenispora]|uniref:hypothetical protein n=1 Tax=Thermomonospora catenispora TaxID=2493090 RepID=UPI001120D9D0|nr:hypothetical protein [Thermomonospora catenispora]TNY37132.1 hypothetical protein EIO00_09815 [Thermomonospora catenispora]